MTVGRERYPYNTPYRSHFRQAQGNLQYLDFIRMVERMWADGYPGIPIVPAGGEQFAVYPSIVYSLQLRKAHPGEPKPKYRDEIKTAPNEKGIIIVGQRFQNVVNFTVVHDEDPRVAEELIETFEDFMLEFIPVFKQCGLSEIVYARRLPDDEQPRVAEGVIMRTVSFLVTTEKIIETSYEKWNSMLVRARLALTQDVLFEVDTDIHVEVEGGVGSVFAILGASFNLGDTVKLYKTDDEFPFAEGLQENMPYTIVAVVPRDADAPGVWPTHWPWHGYVLAREVPGAQAVPISVSASGRGAIGVIHPDSALVTSSVAPATVQIEIQDEQQTPVDVE